MNPDQTCRFPDRVIVTLSNGSLRTNAPPPEIPFLINSRISNIGVNHEWGFMSPIMLPKIRCLHQ